jgi:hypothetical protein
MMALQCVPSAKNPAHSGPTHHRYMDIRALPAVMPRPPTARIDKSPASPGQYAAMFATRLPRRKSGSQPSIRFKKRHSPCRKPSHRLGRPTNRVLARGPMTLKDCPRRPVGSARPRLFRSEGICLRFASVLCFQYADEATRPDKKGRATSSWTTKAPAEWGRMGANLQD